MLDRSASPTFQTITDFSFKHAITKSLDNGVPIHIIDAGTQPVIRLEIVFAYGKWNENKNQASLLTAKMLLEGTHQKSSVEISEIIDGFGAFIEVTPGVDYTTVSLYCIHEFLKPLLDLLSEILNYPSFPGEELRKVKNIQSQTLKINLEKNSYLASDYFRQRLFGKNHPYGRTLSHDSIGDITSNDVNSFYHELKRAHRELIISGQITTKVIDQIKHVFGKQAYSPEVFSKAYNVETNNTPQVENRKDSLQSSLRIGKLMVKKDDKGFRKIFIANTLLGGFFGSRLMKNIREEKGLTYGIHSSVPVLLNSGYFVIGADVMKQNKDLAIQEIYSELKLLRTKLPTGSEMEILRNYLLGTFQSEINTPFSLADKFKGVHLYGMDYDFYDNLFTTIQNCKPSDITSTAEKYFHEDSMLSVVVG